MFDADCRVVCLMFLGFGGFVGFGALCGLWFWCGVCGDIGFRGLRELPSRCVGLRSV